MAARLWDFSKNVCKAERKDKTETSVKKQHRGFFNNARVDSVAYSEKTFALKKLSILSDPKRICHTIIYFLANRPGSLRKWFAFSNTKLSFLALPTHPAVLSQVLTYVSSQGGWAWLWLERKK